MTTLAITAAALIGAALGFICASVLTMEKPQWRKVAPGRREAIDERVLRLPRNHYEPEGAVCIQCHNSFWREQGSGVDYCSGCNSQKGVNDVPSH